MISSLPCNWPQVETLLLWNSEVVAISTDAGLAITQAVLIKGEIYRHGDWCADINRCYFYRCQRRLTDEELDDRKISQLANEGFVEHLKIKRGCSDVGIRNKLEVKGTYIAFVMPRFALRVMLDGSQPGYVETHSDWHHFSLFYGPADCSAKILKTIVQNLEEAFSQWRSWRRNPVERPFALFYDNLREVEVMDPDSRYVKIRHLTDEQITSLEGTDAIHVPEGMTQSQRLQVLRSRDNGRVEEQVELDSDLPLKSKISLLDVQIRHGLVLGETRSLLSFLHDTLTFKCGVWHIGKLEDTQLLGPTSWHVSQQAEGLAKISTTLRPWLDPSMVGLEA